MRAKHQEHGVPVLLAVGRVDLVFDFVPWTPVADAAHDPDDAAPRAASIVADLFSDGASSGPVGGGQQIVDDGNGFRLRAVAFGEAAAGEQGNADSGKIAGRGDEFMRADARLARLRRSAGNLESSTAVLFSHG